MLITTTEDIGKKYNVIGLVMGNTVRARHIGRDITAGLRSIKGGEIKGYSEMLSEAREEAIQRMTTDAKGKGADAIVSVRLTTAQTMQGAAEVLAYGTAVKTGKK